MQNNDHAIQEAMRIAKSAAGQQLIRMLQSQNQDALNQAIRSASAGNYDQARTILSQILSDPEAQKLVEQLGERNG